MHQKFCEDKVGDISSQVSAEYFDQLLKTVPFRTSTSESITISFPQDPSLSGNQPYDVDTDNDDIDKLDAVRLGQKRKKPYNASRLLYSPKKDLTNNYLQQSDLPQQDEISEGLVQPLQQYTQKLCCRLALDALRIVEIHPREQTRSATVCLCVVLRNQDGYAKKFIFHNGASSLPSPMREEADRLKYHIVHAEHAHAEHAHAEGEFVQFLLKRNAQETYTHVIGMGCSRQHCKECNCLLKLSLGRTYHEFTASIEDDKNEEENRVEVLLSQNPSNKVVIDRHQKATSQVLYGEDTVSEKYFKKFSLKELLSSWIKTTTGIKIPRIKRYNNVVDVQEGD